MDSFEQILPLLEKFQSTSDFLKIQQKISRVDSADLFNRGGYNPLLEAWILVRAAAALETKVCNVKIRLVPEREQFPDAEVLVNGRKYNFEITEVMKPGRKRGEEYRQEKEMKESGIVGEPELVGYRFEEGNRFGAKWISSGIKRKQDKRYGTRSNLVVYANFPFYELDAALIADEANSFRDEFDSIWLIHSNNFLQLFDSLEFGCTDLKWHPVDLERYLKD